MTQTGEEFTKEVQQSRRSAGQEPLARAPAQSRALLMPYRWRIAAALVALVCSATVSLLVPQALRIMIDRGFHEAVIARIGLYFLPLVIASGLLGIFTGIRFYLRQLDWRAGDRGYPQGRVRPRPVADAHIL